MRERLPLPKAIQNAPELMLGLEIYFDAFFDLHSCRPIGMAEGPIPWGAIREYAAAWEFDAEQTADLIHHVRSMDRAYLSWSEARTKG